MLQCGDPTGTGRADPATGSPTSTPPTSTGWTDPALKTPVMYPRGTLAMANTGPGTNGSQFFLVYEDSVLPPNYTVFGTIDPPGWPRWTRSPPAVSPAGATTASPRWT